MTFEDVAGVANAVRNMEIAEERGRQGVKRIHDGERVRPAQGNTHRGNDRRVNDTRGSDRQVNDRRGYDYWGYDR